MPYSIEYLQKLQSLFVHLHVHSEYSNIRLLDSTNKLEDMIKYINSIGQHAMALTDHECVSGSVKFLTLVEELKKQNIICEDFKPILGNEIYLVDEQQMYWEMENQGYTTFYHFLLLSKDNIGHEQIRILSSRAWNRMFSYKGIERVPTFYSDLEEVLQQDRGHIVASTACLGGKFPRLVSALINETDEEKQENIKEDIHNFIMWCLDIFGEDNFYIELQPSLQEDQVNFNKKAVEIAKAYNINWIITTDAHYIKETDREIHKAFLTSEDDSNGNREVDSFYGTTHFFTVESIFDNMYYLNSEDIERGIINTNKIATQVNQYTFFEESRIPLTELPPKSQWYTFDYDLDKYQYINEIYKDKEIRHTYLVHQIFKGIEEREIPQDEIESVLDRVNIECKEIIGASKAKHQPMGAYLVTMQKNVDIIWEEAESIVGAGRGSANGYIIDYLLGITQVNPLKQGVEMPHWRFMSAERPDIFDIDIDYSSHKRDVVFEAILKYYQSIGGDVIRVCTFGTKTSKSAIQTACRGLNINSDVALYLSSLVPIERGKVWSIKDCYHGNQKENRKPVTEFKNIVDEYSDKKLLQVMLGVEGLIDKRSSHACGIIIVNERFTKHNATMRTPNGEIISQYELHDSEKVSNLKYDFLNTKTCSMIQLTIEMLVKNGKMKWQGSLRKTYNKYLHPDVIDKDTKEMWNILCRGELLAAFQFESNVGEQAIKLIQPHNLIDAANGNTVMRLMVDSGEQPLEKFVRYKNDIQEWYKDMKEYGLSDDLIVLLEKHLLQDNGVCSSQERMMLLTMDEEVAGFGVIESNKLRKGCAKKLPKEIAKAKDLFFEWGKQKGTPEVLLNYIWDEQIAMQLGYGFSILHAIAYTIILIQQLNLVFYYPSIYWNTAVLLVESGAIDREATEDSSIDVKEKTTNYGEVAKAIGHLQERNVSIALPDINKAEQGFIPNEMDNEILFGFKGIMGINNETAQTIMENRPFKDIYDFHKRMVEVKREIELSTGKKQMRSLVSTTQTIMLIKAGAFDKTTNLSRAELLEQYLKMLYPPKTKLTSKDISKISEFGAVPSRFKDEIRFYNFREYLLSLAKVKDEESKTIMWHKLYEKNNDYMTEYATNFFLTYFADDLEEDKDYKYDNEGNIMIAMGTKRKGSFECCYSQKIKSLTEWLSTKDCIDKYNGITFDNVKNDNMKGNVSSWEMESMNFYYHEHELIKVDKDKYDIYNFNELSEEPEVIGFTKYKGLQYPKFALHRIVGTVLDRDKNKHTVTLLTPSGVVTLKFYSGQFAFYDKTISKDLGIDDKGKNKKVVLEDGWFKRNTLLMVTGFRRGDQFKPKRYKDSIYQHAVQKIIEMKDNGELILQGERIQEV